MPKLAAVHANKSTPPGQIGDLLGRAMRRARGGRMAPPRIVLILKARETGMKARGMGAQNPPAEITRVPPYNASFVAKRARERYPRCS